MADVKEQTPMNEEVAVDVEAPTTEKMEGRAPSVHYGEEG